MRRGTALALRRRTALALPRCRLGPALLRTGRARRTVVDTRSRYDAAVGMPRVILDDRDADLISFSMSRRYARSSLSQNESAMPLAPARAVRPMRWT